MTKFAGSKSGERLTTKEIAQRIRADIKAARATGKRGGDIPPAKDCKISVRIGGSSTHSTVSVYVKTLPYNPMCLDRLQWELDNPHAYIGDSPYRKQHTRAAQRLLATLEAIVDQYNEGEIDSQVDYFNVRFYKHVGFCYQAEGEWTKQAKAMLSPRPAEAAPDRELARAKQAEAERLREHAERLERERERAERQAAELAAAAERARLLAADTVEMTNDDFARRMAAKRAG